MTFDKFLLEAQDVADRHGFRDIIEPVLLNSSRNSFVQCFVHECFVRGVDPSETVELRKKIKAMDEGQYWG